jgi:hypothetical protein
VPFSGTASSSGAAALAGDSFALLAAGIGGRLLSGETSSKAVVALSRVLERCGPVATKAHTPPLFGTDVGREQGVASHLGDGRRQSGRLKSTQHESSTGWADWSRPIASAHHLDGQSIRTYARRDCLDYWIVNEM